VARARAACPNAIVGEGQGTAIVKFPEQEPIKASSPITLFNGPPGPHGDPTVLAHAYLSVPAPTTYIVPIVIEPIHQGIYGYRTKATIPKIAGGAGIPISGHFRIGKSGPSRESTTPTSTPVAKPAGSRPRVNSPSPTAPCCRAPSSNPARRAAEPGRRLLNGSAQLSRAANRLRQRPANADLDDEVKSIEDRRESSVDH
jgi:hypothetical protein